MTRGAAHNRLRIIGGRWRGRKLSFPPVPGLRPTPDRVRETLFNWLQPVIVGARCLDLFAGSGALGFEAASRGAAEVTLVDRDARITRVLAGHVRRLEAEHVQVVHADVRQWLNGPSRVYDVVFLDPPYDQGLLSPCCRLLEEQGWLGASAQIYLEAKRGLGLPRLPPAWSVIRSKQAGQVGYHLALRQPEHIVNHCEAQHNEPSDFFDPVPNLNNKPL